MTIDRRRFLARSLALAGMGLAAGGLGYTYYRGVRFPPPMLTGSGPAMRGQTGAVEVAAEGAVFQKVEDGAFRFRAFVPEPVFKVRGEDEARIVVENVHPAAELAPGSDGSQSATLDEARSNLTRTVSVRPSPKGPAGFAWRFPKSDEYRFAAIGDSGGGTELNWVLRRASELGADFLVHLGDIYYEQGDFNRASINLNGAGIPTYAAIGNHDFYDDWQVLYPEFHRVVGPSNWTFALGGIEFVNFDTAADFIPVDRGRRMELLGSLGALNGSGPVRDRVAITHAPLRDPDPDRDHAVGRRAEARWLRDQLLSRGTRNLLCGHIHIKEEFDDQGLYTYITGQGLAHADLIVDRPYAEILLGDVVPGEPVRYQWQPLNMPFEAHCNERNLGMLDVLEKPDVKEKLLELCGKV